MAEFCQQCSIETFGEDLRDLADVAPPAWDAEGAGAAVLCEGCGNTVVDSAGRCVWNHCPLHGVENTKGAG